MRAFVKLTATILLVLAAGALCLDHAPTGAPAGTATSAWLEGPAVQLSVQNGTVTPSSDLRCRVPLFPDSKLDLGRSTTCAVSEPGASTLVAISSGPSGEVVRARIETATGPGAALGPPLFSITSWDWAHSSIISANGITWIYALESFRLPSPLLEVSQRTGKVLHRFEIEAGANPYLVANQYELFATQSAWGGSSCTGRCVLWHVAPGSDRLEVARRLGARTQWLMAAGGSIYLDVLSDAPHGWEQTIWRLEGPGAKVAYKTPARLLPSPDFAPTTGYVVVGTPAQGFFTLSQLGSGRTPNATGVCDAAAPLLVVRIDPADGSQSYVGAIPRAPGTRTDCHLSPHQAVLHDGALYVLADQGVGLAAYFGIVRVVL